MLCVVIKNIRYIIQLSPNILHFINNGIYLAIARRAHVHWIVPTGSRLIVPPFVKTRFVRGRWHGVVTVVVVTVTAVILVLVAVLMMVMMVVVVFVQLLIRTRFGSCYRGRGRRFSQYGQGFRIESGCATIGFGVIIIGKLCRHRIRTTDRPVVQSRRTLHWPAVYLTHLYANYCYYFIFMRNDVIKTI